MLFCDGNSHLGCKSPLYHLSGTSCKGEQRISYKKTQFYGSERAASSPLVASGEGAAQPPCHASSSNADRSYCLAGGSRWHSQGTEPRVLIYLQAWEHLGFALYAHAAWKFYTGHWESQSCRSRVSKREGQPQVSSEVCWLGCYSYLRSLLTCHPSSLRTSQSTLTVSGPQELVMLIFPIPSVCPPPALSPA